MAELLVEFHGYGRAGIIFFQDGHGFRIHVAVRPGNGLDTGLTVESFNIHAGVGRHQALEHGIAHGPGGQQVTHHPYAQVTAEKHAQHDGRNDQARHGHAQGKESAALEDGNQTRQGRGAVTRAGAERVRTLVLIHLRGSSFAGVGFRLGRKNADSW